MTLVSGDKELCKIKHPQTCLSYAWIGPALSKRDQWILAAAFGRIGSKA